MNRKNLRKLAIYLENLPEGYEYFEMNTFIGNKFGGSIELESEQSYAERNGGVGACGAVACAVGHGPSAGVLFPKASEESNLWLVEEDDFGALTFTPDWNEYSALNFLDSNDHRGEWEWCFGGGWSHVDKTPKGAAKRIRWILAGNNPPEHPNYRGEWVPFQSVNATADHVEMYR